MVTVQCKLKGMSAIFMAKLSKNTMNITNHAPKLPNGNIFKLYVRI
jgi:hypothetical protein